MKTCRTCKRNEHDDSETICHECGAVLPAEPSVTQSHFVVVFDYSTGQFSIDWNTTLARFSDGLHFKNGEWVSVNGLDDREYVILETASELLTNILDDCTGVDVESVE